MSHYTRETTDESLVAAACGGDEAAFGHLVDRYKDVVFATVVAITRDFDGAHDIAQEVFLRAWFGLGKLKEGASLPGWLRTIARNRALTWLERHKRRPHEENIDLTQLPDGADSPERDAEKAEQRRLVEAVLEQLPEGSREVLVLHYLEELTTPEIAQRLEITATAVRQRLRRARLHMQEEMETMVTDVLKDEAPGDDFTESVNELLKRAQELFGRVEYRQAVPLLEQAREQAPEDTLVSLLLADAYTFARGAGDYEEDRGPYDRALALLDEVLEREPDNTLARLRRAAVAAVLAPEEEMLTEQRQIAVDAVGGPYEVVAELELARRYLTCGQRAAGAEDMNRLRQCGQQALVLYKKLQAAHDWLACVLHSEQGVAYAMTQDGAKALRHFNKAAQLTTPEAMAVLQETSERLIGAAYWAFWRTVDNLSVRQCQNYAWLAGLYSMSGDPEQARDCLKQSLTYLNSEEASAAAPVLKKQFVQQMENMFPILAEEPEVQALRQEIMK